LLEADDDLLALLVALGEHPMVEALDMPRPVDGRRRWPISWRTCCRSWKKTSWTC
jgi:hypothetical protein